MNRSQIGLGEFCWLLLCVSLYVASFFLPAVVKGADLSSDASGALISQQAMKGWEAFQNAWRFSFAPWWANPCAWAAIALALAHRTRSAAVIGVLGLILAILAVFLSPFRGRFGMLDLGYWVWAGSMALLAGFYLERATKGRAGRVAASRATTS